MNMLGTIFSLFQVVLTVVVLVHAPHRAPAVRERLVDIGTHRLHVRIEGEGGPVVVIETGIGDLSANWRPVQSRLAEETCVITYDRAGYGASETGPLPRSAARASRELYALLEAIPVDGPCIIVGHSLGGLNAQVFARLHPGRVAGLILLDPPPLGWITGETYPGLRKMAEEMTKEWFAASKRLESSSDGNGRSLAKFYRAIASEQSELFGSSATEAASIASFGDLPLLVIAAGRANPMFGEVADEFQRFWIEENRSLSLKSTRGTFLLLEQSSHHLYDDEPDRIVEAILSMVAAVRSNDPPGDPATGAVR